jgi:bifunctional non-homologous end joining protein LigD
MLIPRNPNKITIDWDSSNRRGKVFFDYNQNSKGKTLASIFSVRPTLSATVSIHIEWRDLSNVRPADFTLLNVPAILSKDRNAWSNICQSRQDFAQNDTTSVVVVVVMITILNYFEIDLSIVFDFSFEHFA